MTGHCLIFDICNFNNSMNVQQSKIPSGPGFFTLFFSPLAWGGGALRFGAQARGNLRRLECKIERSRVCVK